MRILITGSRTWDDYQTIAQALNQFQGQEVTLVSGACPDGADTLCEEHAENVGFVIERHPADWERYGRRAGFIRNREMVDLGADLCLAFIRDNSKGASMTAKLAMDRGIKTTVYTYAG